MFVNACIILPDFCGFSLRFVLFLLPFYFQYFLGVFLLQFPCLTACLCWSLLLTYVWWWEYNLVEMSLLLQLYGCDCGCFVVVGWLNTGRERESETNCHSSSFCWKADLGCHVFGFFFCFVFGWWTKILYEKNCKKLSKKTNNKRKSKKKKKNRETSKDNKENKKNVLNYMKNFWKQQKQIKTEEGTNISKHLHTIYSQKHFKFWLKKLWIPIELNGEPSWCVQRKRIKMFKLKKKGNKNTKTDKRLLKCL